ncbi:putative FAD-linked oxidoreductase [Cupriavidus numazuensis]|uniref:FAD-linked oxidoreductase n=2 Tax=Cupriavidus numazuensis TaxID=221992 RepID=A0ABN7Q038_9BURK|nr:FAD-binding oxidoreductase [Cupriavidus numazuensis]CAG2150973.1 putative FAD-linked oxidoreductase [Cupriavidus numazuensis]
MQAEVQAPNPETTLRAMQAIVGEHACLSGDADMQPFVTDYRGIYRGKAQVVVLPASTEEVSQVMQWCYANGVPVVPQGGNTSLMGGAVPDDTGAAVVINLRRMNRVLAIDAVNDTMAVQAGVTLSAARSAAEAEQRLFPLRIGSEGSCQIGGNLSTNAGGTAVLRYGNMRDLVLGIEAVLPDGRIYSSLRGLRKDNTGYDLKHLFIGAEGTLGIITGAVLKLMPQPRSTAVAFVAVPGPAAAVQLLGEAKRLSGQAVTAFELISRPALELVLEYLGNVPSPLPEMHDWMVLIELTSGTDAESLNATLMEILESGFGQGLVQDAAVAASLSDAQTFWRIREEISDAQTRAGGSIKCDVSVPLSRIAAFVEEASERVLALEPDARMVIYGHMGDGNVHFNPLRPKDRPAKEFLAQWYARISGLVDTMAHAENGSISAEHGIGVVKRDDLAQFKSPVEIELMWQVKQALDPRNLLNPGKVLPAQGR